jgi:hypothetical protein
MKKSEVGGIEGLFVSCETMNDNDVWQRAGKVMQSYKYQGCKLLITRGCGVRNASMPGT